MNLYNYHTKPESLHLYKELGKNMDQDGGIITFDESGEPHGENDKPAIITPDGKKYWMTHGEMHRDGDKPAFIKSDGYAAYWKHGMRHRDNKLPAIIYPHGKKEYWEHGVKIASYDYSRW